MFPNITDSTIAHNKNDKLDTNAHEIKRGVRAMMVTTQLSDWPNLRSIFLKTRSSLSSLSLSTQHRTASACCLCYCTIILYFAASLRHVVS